MDEKLIEAVEANRAEAKNKLSSKDFESDYFSTGLYANFDLGARKRVKTASLDANGIVRVEDGNSSQVGFYIQAHRFFSSKSPNSAHGVFIGIVPSPDGIISAAALGYVYGRRPKASFVSEKSSLNLGIGLSMSPNVNVLGDEINVNHPLPAGEAQIRYKRTTIFGVIMSVTFGF